MTTGTCKFCHATGIVGEDIFTLPDVNFNDYCCLDCLDKAKLCDACGTLGIFGEDINFIQNEGFLCVSCVSTFHICADCGTKHLNGKEIDGKQVCNKCITEHYITCPECKKLVKENTIISSKELAQYPSASLTTGMCKDCFKKKIKKLKPKEIYECEFCKQLGKPNVWVSERQVTATGQHFCESCQSYLFLCDSCKKYHSRRITDVYETGQDHLYVCSFCAGSGKYKWCNICGKLEHKSNVNNNGICKWCAQDLTYCEYCGRPQRKSICKDTPYGKLCSTCLPLYRQCDTCGKVSFPVRGVTSVSGRYCLDCRKKQKLGSINSYSFKPYFRGDPKKLFIGIENEITVNAGTHINDASAWYLDHYDERVVYLKSDSSVYNGFEVVTSPKTFYDWKFKFNPKFLFPEFVRKHSSDGMHIHMSKGAFGNYQLLKFLNFINKNEEFINKIAERIPNHYCGKLVEEYKGEFKKVSKEKSREGRGQINLHPKDTIELRMFQGATCVEQFMKNIEFAHALFTWTSEVSFQNCTEVDTFLKWLESVDEIYENLKDFIKNKFQRTTETQAKVVKEKVTAKKKPKKRNVGAGHENLTPLNTVNDVPFSDEF